MSEHAAKAGQVAADVLTGFLRGIVADPAAVRVQVTDWQAVAFIDLEVDPGDRSRVIGPRGLHFRAAIALVNAIGRGSGVQIRLNGLAQQAHAVTSPYPAAQVWQRKEFANLVVSALSGAFGRCEVKVKDDAESNGTTVTASVPDDADPRSVNEMAGALHVLCGAYGLRHGRAVAVSVKADLMEGTQPATAAGRWAGEIRR